MLLSAFRVIYIHNEGRAGPRILKEENTMKTRFYLDGKKITRKAVKEMVGEERLKRMLKEAKEAFFEDPLEEQSFFLGHRGVLIIEFA